MAAPTGVASPDSGDARFAPRGDGEIHGIKCRAGALTAKFTVPRTWMAGGHTFYVYAIDSAGNKQANVAANKLIVK